MVRLPPLNENDLDLEITYRIGQDEEMFEAIVNAFASTGIDVYRDPTTLADWINPDAIEDMLWSSDRPLYLSTEMWDHRVVITANELRIYASENYQ